VKREDAEITIIFPHEKIKVDEKNVNFIVSQQTVLFLLQERNRLIAWKSSNLQKRIRQVADYIHCMYCFSNDEEMTENLNLIIEMIINS